GLQALTERDGCLPPGRGDLPAVQRVPQVVAGPGLVEANRLQLRLDAEEVPDPGSPVRVSDLGLSGDWIPERHGVLRGRPRSPGPADPQPGVGQVTGVQVEPGAGHALRGNMHGNRLTADQGPDGFRDHLLRILHLANNIHRIRNYHRHAVRSPVRYRNSLLRCLTRTVRVTGKDPVPFGMRVPGRGGAVHL